MSLIRSSTVTLFFLGGVFVVGGGGGVGFSTRGVETFGSTVGLLTGVTVGFGAKIGFGAKDEGDVIVSVTGVAPIFGSGVVFNR